MLHGTSQYNINGKTEFSSQRIPRDSRHCNHTRSLTELHLLVLVAFVHRGVNWVWQGYAAAIPWVQGGEIKVTFKYKSMNVSLSICAGYYVVKLQ